MVERTKKIFFIIMLTVWMGVIFWFSAKPADESSKMSNKVGMIFSKIFIPEFKNWPPEQQEAFAQKVDYPVRKTAHALEYALLALLWIMVLGYKKNSVILSLFFTFIYACSDEFHQIFVDGRAGKPTDVLIDTLGAMTGLLILSAVMALFKNKHLRGGG